MFTGIIQEIGKISRTRKTKGGIELSIESSTVVPGLNPDDSIAVNGVCQTVTSRSGNVATVFAVEETLAKTTLGSLTERTRVNLEPPLRLSDRLGGHMVLGHVDCVGSVMVVENLESSRMLTVTFAGEFRRYVIPVGSIAIDGVSLTVASLGDDWLKVALIPHTLDRTTLSSLDVGSKVNLEFDVLGKYLDALMNKAANSPADDGLRDRLKTWGYEI